MFVEKAFLAPARKYPRFMDLSKVFFWLNGPSSMFVYRM